MEVIEGKIQTFSVYVTILKVSPFQLFPFFFNLRLSQNFSQFTPNHLYISTYLGLVCYMVWSEMMARAPLLGREAVIELWISDGCILLRPAERARGGGNKMTFSLMCFCPHCRFHSCLITLGGPANKVICWSPTVLCLSLLQYLFLSLLIY